MIFKILIGLIIALIPGIVLAEPLTLSAMIGYFGTGTFATVAGTTAFIATQLAIAFVAGKILAPNVDARNKDRKQTIKSGIEPRRIVYGEAYNSGPLVYLSTSGNKNKFLHMIVALSTHPADSMVDLLVNDEVFSLSDPKILNGTGTDIKDYYVSLDDREANEKKKIFKEKVLCVPVTGRWMYGAGNDEGDINRRNLISTFIDQDLENPSQGVESIVSSRLKVVVSDAESGMSDEVEILKVYFGSQEVKGVLTNAVHYFTFGFGQHNNFYGKQAGGTFKVWDGSDDITGNGPVYGILNAGVPVGTSFTKSGVTLTIDQTGTYVLTGFPTSDSILFELRADYNGQFIVCNYTLNKVFSHSSIEAGDSYKSLELKAVPEQTFRYTATNILVGPPDIQFTAKVENVSGENLQWSVYSWDNGWVLQPGALHNVVSNFAMQDGNTITGDQVVTSAILGHNAPWKVATHRLDRCSYVYVRVTNSDKAFSGNIPNIAVKMRGKRLYNPLQDKKFTEDTTYVGEVNKPFRDRGVYNPASNYVVGDLVSARDFVCIRPNINIPTSNTNYWLPTYSDFINDDRQHLWLYSNNWALASLDYLLNSIYGLGLDISTLYNELDWTAALNAVKDSYDGGYLNRPTNTIPASRFTTEDSIFSLFPKFSVDGVLDTATTPIQNLETLFTASSGEMAYSQGKHSLHAGVYREAVGNPSIDYSIVVDESYLSGEGVSLDTAIPNSDLFNIIQGVYVDSQNKGELTEFDPLYSEEYIEADGQEYTMDVDYPMTTNYKKAQLLAVQTLEKSRLNEVYNLTCNFKIFKYKVGDVVFVKNDLLGYNENVFPSQLLGTDSYKQFEIISMDIKENFEVEVTFKEISYKPFNPNFVWNIPPEREMPVYSVFGTAARGVLRPTNLIIGNVYIQNSSIGIPGHFTDVFWRGPISETPTDIGYTEIDGYQVRYAPVGMNIFNEILQETTTVPVVLRGTFVSGRLNSVVIDNPLTHYGYWSDGQITVNTNFIGGTESQKALVNYVALGNGRIEISEVEYQGESYIDGSLVLLSQSDTPRAVVANPGFSVDNVHEWKDIEVASNISRVDQPILTLALEKGINDYVVGVRSRAGDTYSNWTYSYVRGGEEIQYVAEGIPGTSTVIVNAYKISETIPVDNPGTVDYNVATGEWTPQNGWLKALSSGSMINNPTVWVMTQNLVTDQIGSISLLASGWEGPIQILSSGEDGLSIAELLIFRRSSTVPITPVGGQYNFDTKVLTPPTDWHTSIPAGTDPVFVAITFANIVGSTGIDTSLTWSEPVKAFADGIPGQSIDIIFRRSASLPATPVASVGTPVGWYSNVNDVPASTDPMWSSVGTRETPDSNWVWQLPVRIEGTQGQTGQAGRSVAEILVFMRSSTLPTTPIGGVYNFDSQSLTTAPAGGWTSSVPGGTDPVYVSRGIASIIGISGTDTPSWGPVSKAFQDGADGTSISIIGSVADVGGTPQVTLNTAFPSPTIGDGVIDEATGNLWIWDGTLWNNVGNIQGPQGNDGISVAELTVYLRAPSLPATPSGGSFSFTDQLLTPPPGGWSVTIPEGTDPVYASRGISSIVGNSGSDVPSWGTPFKAFEDGIGARTVYLAATGQAVEYNSAGNRVGPTSITFTATSQNLVGAAYYRFYINGVDQGIGVSNTLIYNTPTTYFPAPITIKVEVREGSDIGPIVAEDQMGIYAIKPGADNVIAILSNEVHTFSADNVGTVSSYTSSGTTVRAFSGVTALQYETGTGFSTINGRFRITRSTSNISGGAVSGNGTTTATYANASNMTADAATITYVINAKTPDGQEVSVTKIQSFSKSKQGNQGTEGRSVAEILVFKRSATLPSVPTGGLYDFSTQSLTTPPTGDWTSNVPGGTDPVYVSRGVASIIGNSGTDIPSWGTVSKAFQDGADGTSISIIGSVADVGATPQTTLNTAFPSPTIGDGVIDEATGNLWIWDGTLWNNVGNIQGPQGNDGRSVAEITIYIRSPGVPAQPSGGLFNFTDQILTPPVGGWSGGIPAGTDPVYASNGIASIIGTSGSDVPNWGAPVRVFSEGISPTYYFIKPLNGTAIKNSTGTLTVEAWKIEAGVASKLTSGAIQLYNPDNTALGYDEVFNSASINNSIIITLKEGAGGTVLDTITLVDITDGEGSVVGWIEPNNPLAWVRAQDQTTWTPSTTTLDFNCYFYKDGTPLARIARRITRNAAGALSVSTITHKDTDLNIIDVSVTLSGSGSTRTITFTHIPSGVKVSETALSVLSGMEGKSKLRSYVFARSATVLTDRPTGGTYASPVPTSTPTFTDGIPAGTNPIYVSNRLFTSDATAPQEDLWTVPVLFAQNGQNGDGTSSRYIFSSSATAPALPAPNLTTGWDLTAAETTVWISFQINTTNNSGVILDYGPWEPAVKIKGEQGVSVRSATLSNVAHVIPANSDGTGSVLTGSGTLISAYNGEVQLQYETGTGFPTINGRFRVTFTTLNVTSSSTSGSIPVSGLNAQVGDLATISQDSGLITYTINTMVNGVGISLVRIQSFSRAKQGNAGVAGQRTRVVYLYKKGDNNLTTNTFGTYADPKSGAETGWDYTIPSLTENGEIVYVTTRTFTSDGLSPQDATWTAPVIYSRRTDGNTVVGPAGQSTKTVTLYKLNDPNITTNTFGTFADPKSGAEAGWDYNIPGLVNDNDTVYVTLRTFTSDGLSPQDAIWTVPVIYSRRIDGNNAQDTRYPTIFRLNSNTIVTSSGTFADPLSGNTSWSYSVPSLTADGDIVYSSSRRFTSDGLAPQDAAWSTPTIYSRRTDGNTVVGPSGQVIRTVNLFKKNDSNITTNTFGTFADPKSGAETGWDYPVPALTANGDIVRVVTRTFTSDGLSPQDATWTAPVVYAIRTDGTNSRTVILSNETHSIRANSDGTGEVLNGSGTLISAYAGTTALTYEAGTGFPSTSGRFRVVISSSIGVTPGAITLSSPNALVADLTAMSGDTGSITYTVNTTADTVNVAITKVQTFSKVRIGSSGSSALNVGRKMDRLDQWFEYTTGLPLTAWTIETVNGPTGILGLQHIDNTSTSNSIKSESVTFNPLKKYRVSFWARQPSGDRVNIPFIQFYDSANNIIASGTSPIASDATGWPTVGAVSHNLTASIAFPITWTLYTFEFGGDATATIPTGAVTLRLCGSYAGAGTTSTTVQLQDYHIVELADTGQSKIRSYVFARSATVLATRPTGGNYASPVPTSSPTFTDGIPSGTNPIYVSNRLFTSDGLAPQESLWTVPVLFAQNGDNGNGTSTRYIFSSNTTAPSLPANNATTGWSLTPTSTTIWMSQQVNITNTLGEVTTYGAWQTAIRIKGEVGITGTHGTRTAILDVYRWAASPPTGFPSGSSTYTWATGLFTSPTLNGWSLTPPPPVLGQTLYIARQIHTNNNTDVTSPVTWTTSTALPLSYSGDNGQRVGFLEVYRWAATAPTGYPSGTSNYTWATGAFTAPTTPNGWSLTPGAPTEGFTLWGISVRISNNNTDSISVATWNSTSVYAVGYAGSQGSTGPTGTSVSIVYVKSATAPATPTSTANPPTTPITWYATVAAAITAGGTTNPLWSSVGTSTNGTTWTWQQPVRMEGVLSPIQLSDFANTVDPVVPVANIHVTLTQPRYMSTTGVIETTNTASNKLIKIFFDVAAGKLYSWSGTLTNVAPTLDVGVYKTNPGNNTTGKIDLVNEVAGELAAANAAATLKNSEISLSVAGALSGAGGGTIALGSIGGSLNLASQVTGLLPISNAPATLINSNIALSAAGILSGGGASVQVNLGNLPGQVIASQIAADSIYATKLAVLSKHLVNPVSMTKTLAGWGGILEDGTGSATNLSYDATENAIELISSGDNGFRSNTFDVDHNKIYKVHFKLKKDIVNGIIFAGLSGYTSYSVGLMDGGGGSLQFSRYLSTRVFNATATNIYHVAGTAATTSYVEYIVYVIGFNRSINDCPNHVGSVTGGSSSFFPYIKIADETCSHLALRFLNWTNAGTTTSLFVKDVSVIEVGSGQIVADNITANAITAGKIAANEIHASKLAVLAKHLINPISQTGVLNGWGGILEDGTGTSTPLTYSSAENALALTSELNHITKSNSFEIDNNKIYRVAFKHKKNISGGTFWIAVVGSTTPVVGLTAVTDSNARQFTRYNANRTTNSTSASPYFFWGQTAPFNATAGAGYTESVCYLIGMNRSIDDCPNHVGDAVTPYVKVADALTKHVSVTLLNWTNTASTILYVKDISVTEMGSGQIVAENITANAITASKILAGQVNTGHMTADSISGTVISAGTLIANKLAVISPNLIYDVDTFDQYLGQSTNGSAGNINTTESVVVNNYSYTGGNSLKHVSTGTSSFKYITATSGSTGWLRIQPGKRYIFSAYVFSPLATVSVQLACVLFAYGTTSVLTTPHVIVSSSVAIADGWKRISGITDVISGSADPAASFYIRHVSSGHTTYWDGFQLEEYNGVDTSPSFFKKGGLTVIDGGNIITNSIHANRIATGTLSANQIFGGTISAGVSVAGSFSTTGAANGPKVIMSGSSNPLRILSDASDNSSDVFWVNSSGKISFSGNIERNDADFMTAAAINDLRTKLGLEITAASGGGTRFISTTPISISNLSGTGTTYAVNTGTSPFDVVTTRPMKFRARISGYKLVEDSGDNPEAAAVYEVLIRQNSGTFTGSTVNVTSSRNVYFVGINDIWPEPQSIYNTEYVLNETLEITLNVPTAGTSNTYDIRLRKISGTTLTTITIHYFEVQQDPAVGGITAGATAYVAGSSSTGALAYNGNTLLAGALYGQTAVPSGNTRLNYAGHFHATQLFEGGTARVATLSAGNVFTGQNTVRGPIGTDQYAIGYLQIPTATFNTGTPANREIVGKCVHAAGNITLPVSVFSAGDAFMIYAGTSPRAVTRGTNAQLRIAGESTEKSTGITLAAYGMASIRVVVGGATPQYIISGGGVS